MNQYQGNNRLNLQFHFSSPLISNNQFALNLFFCNKTVRI